MTEVMKRLPAHVENSSNTAEKGPSHFYQDQETQLKTKGYNFTLATDVSHNNINVFK